MFTILLFFLIGLTLLWALRTNSGIVNPEINKWYLQYKRAIWLCVILFAAAYLVLHYFLFDRYVRYSSAWNFIKQGKWHIWHIAPLLLIFGYFFTLEGMNRWEKRKIESPNEK